jgi:hypothetical protein
MIFRINDSNNRSSCNIISRLSILISKLQMTLIFEIYDQIENIQIRFSFAEKKNVKDLVDDYRDVFFNLFR